MLGLMQNQPLLVSSIIKHAAKNHGSAEIVSRMTDGTTRRTNYRNLEARCRRLVRALQRLGVGPADRVATLAWNSQRHLELYYAVSGMGSVVHTVNPRLAPDDVAFILNDAGSVVLCADLSFVPLLETIAPQIPGVRAVVLLADAGEMPEVRLAPGQRLLCYEAMLAEADEDFAWPTDIDEQQASALCYTSGTTGRPKGVLYSHRSTLIHAYAINLADVFGLRSIDRVLPIVPMFHVNAWGIPYAAPMVGAALVMPGRHLDGASVFRLLQEERVSFSAGVPTVWMGLLQYLRSSGEKLDYPKRLVTGGSACPPMLLETLGQYGVKVIHAWGMSETSPLGTCWGPKPSCQDAPAEELTRLRLKQGRTVPGLELRIVDDNKRELPWDGVAFGNLEVRGPWVLRRYFNAESDAADAEGWFATGDVATIDKEGFLELTDRSKDVVKSGGEWISSIQLENIAVSHPDVAEAAVVAAKHPRWDERPLLIVVPKPDRSIDPQSLLAIYQGRVAKWWVPDEVVVVDELPHTATGKLNKLALRQQFRDYRLASAAE